MAIPAALLLRAAARVKAADMVGRVRRLAGLREAEARAAAVAASPACALCDRPLGARVEGHHVVPRSEGGRETVPLHPICHRMIHRAATNGELAQLGDLDGVRALEPIARFLRWIADKPPDFSVPVRRGR